MIQNTQISYTAPNTATSKSHRSPCLHKVTECGAPVKFRWWARGLLSQAPGQPPSSLFGRMGVVLSHEGLQVPHASTRSNPMDLAGWWRRRDRTRRSPAHQQVTAGCLEYNNKNKPRALWDHSRPAQSRGQEVGFIGKPYWRKFCFSYILKIE